VGLGKTGIALARLMAGGGALVTINDILIIMCVIITSTVIIYGLIKNLD